MKRKTRISTDPSTEEKIKSAARRLFTQKGFAAVKTRDIASEAGINIALLNYYFRSKEKLFDLIMLENLGQFMRGVTVIFNDKNSSVEAIVEKMVAGYIDLLTTYPDLPLFVLSELRRNPDKFAQRMDAVSGLSNSYFIKQLQVKIKGKNEPIHPLHFIANIIGLTVFPFVASPILRKIGGVGHEDFIRLMEERKKLIPLWVKQMMKQN